jgi:predicted RNA polymerase sigma factor
MSKTVGRFRLPGGAAQRRSPGRKAGSAAGLLALDTAAADPTIADHHRTHAVRAHFLEDVGDLDGARNEYERAARLTHSVPERQHLLRRAARLA